MKNKKIILLISLIVTLLIMAGGYAIYSSQLKVTGTGSIDSNFNIEVTGIEEESKKGKAVSVTEPTYTSSTATFNTKLQRPGDNIEYEVELTNNGTVDGKINAITITNPSTIAKVETRGIAEGEIIKSGEVKTYIVRVFVPDGTKITEDITSVIEVNTEIVQDDNQIFNAGIDGIEANKLEIVSTKEESDYTSIKATVNAKGNGLKYYYSLDNETWTNGITTNTYTFTGLEIGTRYTVYYKVEDENLNYVTESKWIETKDTTSPVITVSNETEWMASKEVTFTYPEIEGATYYYKIGNGQWKEATQNQKVEVTENTVVYAKIIKDGKEKEREKEISKIDNGEISLELATSATTNSITVVANAEAKSGLTKYEYSVDNGETWKDNGRYNNYTFKNLVYNTTYNIKVRVTSGNGNKATKTVEVKTGEINSATFSESGTTTKTVTITYPEGCGDNLTCTYIKDSEEEVEITGNTVNVEFNTDGTIIAKVSGGKNEVSNTYNVVVDRTITYDYMTNGGSSATKTSEVVAVSSSVDLSPTATKSGWTFVGWNTNKDATSALSSYSMPASNVTLYAIYRKESIKITLTYEKEAGVNAIGTTSNSCTIAAVYNGATQDTSCSVTLPTITTATEYTANGWYSGSTKIGNAGASVNVSANAIYTATAIDTVKPTVTLSPNAQSTHVSGGKAVTLTLSDAGSGLKASQKIYYAWSTSSSSAPSYSSYVTTTNTAVATSTTVTVPASASSSLTGTYYLWVKVGTLSDVSNNTNLVATSSAFKFDNTDPSLSVTTSKTTKSITVVANASAESGISKYEYSSNGGSSWVTGTGNTYTFDNLTHATAYNIRVRVTSGVNKTTTSASTSVTTNIVATPTFNETGTTTKTVTITYPSGCGSTLTCSYIKDGGSAVPVTMATQNVSFTSDGTLIAQVNDGKNYITSSTYTVTVLITHLPSLASSRLHLVVYDTGEADAFTSDSKSSITDVRIDIGRRDGVSFKTYWFSSYTGTYSGVGWGLGTGGFGNVPNYGFNAYISSLTNDLGGLDYKMYAQTYFTDVGTYPNLYNQSPAWIEFYPRVKISFDANGGTGAPTAVYKYLGRELTLSSTVPVRSGYVFTGWSITNDNIPEYAPGLKLGYNSWNYTQYLHMSSNWIDGIGVTNVIEYPEGGAITPTGTNNITLYACWNSIS